MVKSCRCEFVQPIAIWMMKFNFASVVLSATSTLRQMGGRRPCSVIFNW
jgi:hypothetical protein